MAPWQQACGQLASWGHGVLSNSTRAVNLEAEAALLHQTTGEERLRLLLLLPVQVQLLVHPTALNQAAAAMPPAAASQAAAAAAALQLPHVGGLSTRAQAGWVVAAAAAQATTHAAAARGCTTCSSSTASWGQILCSG